MAQKMVISALLCLAGMSASQTYQTYPAQLYPAEHRLFPTAYKNIRPIEELPSMNNYEFHIVPSTAVAEYENPTDHSIWDYIPDPISAVSSIASNALSAAKWTLAKAPLIILGMALVIGFCAFTPYCTLIIEKPFAREIRSLNIPYLDDMEYYLKTAYEKYRDMQ